MTDVLAVATAELCDPVLDVILMKARDRTEQRSGHDTVIASTCDALFVRESQLPLLEHRSD